MDAPGVGHNSEAVRLPDPAAHAEAVMAEVAEIRDRLLDLRVGLDRLPADITADNAPTVTDFVAQCQKAAAEWEKARKLHKGRADAVAKALQDAFTSRVAPLNTSVEKTKARLGAYHAEVARKEREARTKAEAEARAKAEAAQREADEAAEAARRAAEAASGTDARDAAKAAQAAQDEADARAKAAAQEARAAQKLSHAPVHLAGEYGGSTGYARKLWRFEVEDLAKLPLSFLTVDEAAVKEYLAAETKSGNTPTPVDGLRFYQEHSFVVKGT
jgi:hypothetical protein